MCALPLLVWAASMPANFPARAPSGSAVRDPATREAMWAFVEGLAGKDVDALANLAADTVKVKSLSGGKRTLRGGEVRSWLAKGKLLDKFDPTGSALQDEGGRALAPAEMDACGQAKGSSKATLLFGCGGDFLTAVRWELQDDGWKWVAVEPVNLRGP
jgi:hypothetical protein